MKERLEWDQELAERRLNEQARIKAWEESLQARHESERQRVEKWERAWEDSIQTRKERERLRQEGWELELQERRREERSRMQEWEELLKKRNERERLREEQWQREEEERQRLGLYWGHLEADAHCTAYNTRSYRAQLLNTVPYQYNWLKPCLEIPIDIHGKSVRATTCEVKDVGI